MSWKLFMWWFKHLYLAFNCWPQTNMLFFKFIWLHTGFRETWKFSFKTKNLGRFGCWYNYSPDHNRVVREQIRSRPALCMIRLIRGNLTAEMLFKSKGHSFVLKSCTDLWKILVFQVANRADTTCFPFFKRNWKDESTISLALPPHIWSEAPNPEGTCKAQQTPPFFLH